MACAIGYIGIQYPSRITPEKVKNSLRCSTF
jgi:hypothetical protein